MNEELAQIKAMIEDLESLPSEITSGITMQDLRQAISEIYLEEFGPFQDKMMGSDTEEQQEALRSFVEHVAEKVALIIAYHTAQSTEPEAVALIDAEEALAITRAFFAHGSAKIEIHISERQ